MTLYCFYLILWLWLSWKNNGSFLQIKSPETLKQKRTIGGSHKILYIWNTGNKPNLRSLCSDQMTFFVELYVFSSFDLLKNFKKAIWIVHVKINIFVVTIRSSHQVYNVMISTGYSVGRRAAPRSFSITLHKRKQKAFSISENHIPYVELSEVVCHGSCMI